MKKYSILYISNGKGFDVENSLKTFDAVEKAKLLAENNDGILIVDYDMEQEGYSLSLPVLKEIAESVSVPLILKGNFHSLDSIKFCIEEVGAKVVLLSSKCVFDPYFISDAIHMFGNERLAVDCNVCNEKVFAHIKGKKKWHNADEIVLRTKNLGIDKLFYSEKDKENHLANINFERVMNIKKISDISTCPYGNEISIGDFEKLEKDNIALVCCDNVI